ncbi:hypothetical protein B0T16DRAFT_458688 [Cercophora newfieldiana]|uniref:Uncharacterized protein n=1 Tax=Cercophora newfieldiana TaxID=92897 RepID=A0AA39Y6E9_9PEZI|nr:hypothetical protein B0T16DRAFT_458688 [Cercophora newfieldiana]
MEGLTSSLPKLPPATRPHAEARKQLDISELRILGKKELLLEPPPPDWEASGPVSVPKPIPDLDPQVLSTTVAHPDQRYFTPMPESVMPDPPALRTPTFPLEDAEVPLVLPPVEGIAVVEPAHDTPPGLFSSNPSYLASVLHQITTPFDAEETALEKLGFIDEHGYVVELADGKPTSLGEATYFTAVAATAVALTIYSADDASAAALNKTLEGFLKFLQTKSWGNVDERGVSHPIRHPAWVEYDVAGNELRCRPLNRDSFAQIVAAAYYSYRCPKSSGAVRDCARAIIASWIEYLPPRDYRTHSNYIKAFDEFEKDGGKFKHLYADDKGRNQISYLDHTTFRLMPHEIASLRRCGDAMGLDTTSLAPLAFQILGALSSFAGPVADSIASKVTDTLDRVLDALDVEISASVELIPGWSKSKVKKKIKLGIPRHLRDEMLRICRRAVREYVNLFFLGGAATAVPPSLVDFVGELSHVLAEWVPLVAGLDFTGLLRTALDQVLAVLSDTFVLEDAIALSIAAAWASAKPEDSSMAGFMFWNFAVCFDAQPALITFAMEPARAYNKLIQLSGNGNGMWAWLCGVQDDVVADQLRTFEQHPSGWTQYAYASTPYDEWVGSKLVAESDASTTGELSSRIDYLALLGFFKTGRPRAPLLLLHMTIKDLVVDITDSLVHGIQDAVESTGKYVEKFTDAAGDLVIKTISVQGEIMYETFDAVQQTTRLVANVDGRIRQTLWDAAGSMTAEYENAVGDLLPPFGRLVLFQVAPVDAALRLWKWSDSVFSEFQQWESRVVDGVMEYGKLLARQLRNPDGQLRQVVYAAGEGAVLGWTVWSKSTELGVAVWEDCVEILLRDPTGVMTKWVYEPGKVLSKVFRWAKSSIDGAAEAADTIQSVIRESSTQLAVILWGPAGAFLDYRKWATSMDVGDGVQAVADSLQLVQLRDSVTSALEEWVFEGGAAKEYRKWAKSLANGTAEAVDQILRVISVPDGFEIHWFKDGAAVASKLVDKAYKVIKDVLGGIAGGLGGLFG